jgi:hypothetical protein
MGCEKSDYLESFANEYCYRFAETENHYSANGRKFLSVVGDCLRKEIASNIDNLNCKSVKPFAADSHVLCYVQSGYCDLDFQDRLQIFKTVFLPTIFDGTFREVARQLNEQCWSR